MKKVLTAVICAALLIAAIIPSAGFSAEASGYRGEKLSEYSTGYSNSSAARKFNIALAAKKLNGAEIKPGEKFSFNTVVGPRTAENGFRSAHIILDGKFVDGIGGGVCQVSTTLYNAVLRAGLEVLYSAPHSLPVGYVSHGFDAMVSSATDFVFLNSTPYPVFLKAEANGSRLKILIFGFPLITDGERWAFRSVTVKSIESSEYERIIDKEGALAEGENERYISHPKSGLICETYRDIFYQNNLVRSERIRRVTYAAQKGKVLVREEKEQNKEDTQQSFMI